MLSIGEINSPPSGRWHRFSPSQSPAVAPPLENHAEDPFDWLPPELRTAPLEPPGSMYVLSYGALDAFVRPVAIPTDRAEALSRRMGLSGQGASPAIRSSVHPELAFVEEIELEVQRSQQTIGGFEEENFEGLEDIIGGLDIDDALRDRMNARLRAAEEELNQLLSEAQTEDAEHSLELNGERLSRARQINDWLENLREMLMQFGVLQVFMMSSDNLFSDVQREAIEEDLQFVADNLFLSLETWETDTGTFCSAAQMLYALRMFVDWVEHLVSSRQVDISDCSTLWDIYRLMRQEVSGGSQSEFAFLELEKEMADEYNALSSSVNMIDELRRHVAFFNSRENNNRNIESLLEGANKFLGLAEAGSLTETQVTDLAQFLDRLGLAHQNARLVEARNLLAYHRTDFLGYAYRDCRENYGRPAECERLGQAFDDVMDFVTMIEDGRTPTNEQYNSFLQNVTYLEDRIASLHEGFDTLSVDRTLRSFNSNEIADIMRRVNSSQFDWGRFGYRIRDFLYGVLEPTDFIPFLFGPTFYPVAGATVFGCAAARLTEFFLGMPIPDSNLLEKAIYDSNGLYGSYEGISAADIDTIIRGSPLAQVIDSLSQEENPLLQQINLELASIQMLSSLRGSDNLDYEVNPTDWRTRPALTPLQASAVARLRIFTTNSQGAIQFDLECLGRARRVGDLLLIVETLRHLNENHREMLPPELTTDRGMARFTRKIMESSGVVEIVNNSYEAGQIMQAIAKSAVVLATFFLGAHLFGGMVIGSLGGAAAVDGGIGAAVAGFEGWIATTYAPSTIISTLVATPVVTVVEGIFDRFIEGRTVPDDTEWYWYYLRSGINIFIGGMVFHTVTAGWSPFISWLRGRPTALQDLFRIPNMQNTVPNPGETPVEWAPAR